MIMGVAYIRRCVLAFLAAGLSACATPVERELFMLGAPSDPGAFTAQGVTATPHSMLPGPRGGNQLYVGSFNIENLGPGKAGRPEIMARLGEIIRAHDIIAIQEVSDRDEVVPRRLLAAVNRKGAHYSYVLSPRTGRQADDRGSQEQYAIYYDTRSVELIQDLGVYDDASRDMFQREPQIAEFRSRLGSFRFGMINIHTPPRLAVSEIAALDEVAKWAKQRLAGIPVIILGDFNGGCTYATPQKLEGLAIREQRYNWVIPDTADTVLSRGACAYDRIVLTDAARFTGRWNVWRAFMSDAISDHWPVWASFNVDE